MKPRVPALSAIFAASVAIAHAHPGHDDGHELTWDFTHLAQHPWAMLMGVAVFMAAGWTTVKLIRMGRSASAKPQEASSDGLILRSR